MDYINQFGQWCGGGLHSPLSRSSGSFFSNVPFFLLLVGPVFAHNPTRQLQYFHSFLQGSQRTGRARGTESGVEVAQRQSEAERYSSSCQLTNCSQL